MKWLVILTVVVLSLLVYFLDGGEAHEQGPTDLTYYVHLVEGEERRDIDFGVIASTSTTSSSTTSTSPPNPNGTTTTDPTVPSSGTSTTVPSVTGTTSPTPLVTVTTTTTPTPTTGTVPTLRNRTVLVGALVALLTYWLWKRRPKDG